MPGPWHERLPHFRLEFTPSKGDELQSEYLVPRAHGAAALAALRGLRPAARAADQRGPHGRRRRPLAEPVDGGDTSRCTSPGSRDTQVEPAVAAVEAALAPFDPRPHWGKLFGTDPAVVRARYPRWGDFAALAVRHDPERRFHNAYLDRYVDYPST